MTKFNFATEFGGLCASTWPPGVTSPDEGAEIDVGHTKQAVLMNGSKWDRPLSRCSRDNNSNLSDWLSVLIQLRAQSEWNVTVIVAVIGLSRNKWSVSAQWNKERGQGGYLQTRFAFYDPRSVCLLRLHPEWRHDNFSCVHTPTECSSFFEMKELINPANPWLPVT